LTTGRSLAEAAYAALAAGDPSAAQLFEGAIDADPTDSSLLIGQAEALLSAGSPQPTRRLEEALALDPEWVEGHSVLASLGWELGDQENYAARFRAVLSAHPRNPALWNGFIQVLQGVGDYAGAAEAAAQAQRYFDDPVLKLIEAVNRGLEGDDDAVEALLRQVPAMAARDEVEVRHRIRRQDYVEASVIVERMLARPDVALDAWALAEILWRESSDPRWKWLAGSPQFIIKVQLAYSADQLGELTTTLGALHRQRLQPTGQSVRGGTQTRGKLFERSDPAIMMLRDALQSAVDAYRDQLPPFDAAHPLLKHRNRHLHVHGGWSVRLSGAGFHVPHLHPAGVLSSAFYVRVPELDKTNREGSLELGRPPVDLRMDLKPLAVVEPEPGCLILFPSYLYHGTRPFRSGERMSVAFDVI
jgi:Tfp pilus assembly protein PilF